METRGKLFVQEDTMDLASLIYTGKDRQGNCGFPQSQTHLGLFADRSATYQHVEREGKTYGVVISTTLRAILHRYSTAAHGVQTTFKLPPSKTRSQGLISTSEIT